MQHILAGAYLFFVCLLIAVSTVFAEVKATFGSPHLCAVGIVGACDYFSEYDATNIWHERLEDWLRRERISQHTSRSQKNQGVLEKKYWDVIDQLAKEKLPSYEVAEELSVWIQEISKSPKDGGHYIEDSWDHWATTREVFAQNGDDCDGLASLLGDALLELGFDKHKVFMAVFENPMRVAQSLPRRGRLEGYHMVILWFDSADPLILDPTGAISSGLSRASSVTSWRPLLLFNKEERYVPQPTKADIAKTKQVRQRTGVE